MPAAARPPPPLFCAVLAAAGLLLHALPAPVRAAELTPQSARAFIESLSERALQTLQGSDRSLEEREAAVRDLLSEGFALEFIGKFSLGKYWRTASAEERADYLQLFREFFLRTYASRLGGYQGEQFQVDGASPAGDTDVVVQTHIVPASGQPVRAGWRVRMVDGQRKIIDITVEGVSMALNQRQEFTSVVARDGIAGLLEMLRARTQRLPAQAPS